ncbi:hypothetical protein BSZ35_05490 [Salinibacter sp. 10B]|nr:hypothetical protein BSZ35_05490 [Salinibacter sp. 10B]
MFRTRFAEQSRRSTRIWDRFHKRTEALKFFRSQLILCDKRRKNVLENTLRSESEGLLGKVVGGNECDSVT